MHSLLEPWGTQEEEDSHLARGSPPKWGDLGHLGKAP